MKKLSPEKNTVKAKIPQMRTGTQGPVFFGPDYSGIGQFDAKTNSRK